MWKAFPPSLVALALVYVLFDAVKPLTIDDAAYHYYARQAAEHPLDPYGFAIYWYDRAHVANEILAPMVVPYWWSIAIRLFGDNPVMWKLWLFPFALLFAWSLFAIFRRFCRGLEVPLTWLTVLSPAFLPSLNLMLDVPALALSLASLVVFFRACDRNSLTLAAVAGLSSGIAMQTKYTGVVAPAVMFFYALLLGRLRLWPIAVLVAAQVFISWELLIAILYGRSHFLLAAQEAGGGNFIARLGKKASLIWPLVSILGGIAPAVILVAMIGLRVRPAWLLLAILLSLAVYPVLGGIDMDFTARVSALDPATGEVEPVSREFSLAQVVFGIFGIAFCAWLTATLVPILGMSSRGMPFWPHSRRLRRAWFLVAWLGLEVLLYFPLTPFAAVRRVLGIVVVSTLLTGFLAARTSRPASYRPAVWGAVVLSAILGLVYWTVDLLDANAEMVLAEEGARTAREHGAGTVWYIGHWGFQYYAERAGMKPVVTRYSPTMLWYYPDEGPIPLPAPSRLRKGDWLVVPDYRVNQQDLVIDPDYLEEVGKRHTTDWIKLRTVMCFYCGDTPMIHRKPATRLEVTLYRVREDFTPVSTR